MIEIEKPEGALRYKHCDSCGSEIADGKEKIMMVTVKTDTDIFLNVEGFEAREGRSDKVGSHVMCIERPGLYIKPTSYARYIPVIYCDVEKAKKMLDNIVSMVNYYYPNVLVLEIHDGEIRRL